MSCPLMTSSLRQLALIDRVAEEVLRSDAASFARYHSPGFFFVFGHSDDIDYFYNKLMRRIRCLVCAMLLGHPATKRTE